MEKKKKLVEVAAAVAAVVLWFAGVMMPVTVGKSVFDVTTISFDEGFTRLFGDNNLVRSDNGNSVQLFLSRYTGSGFISSDMYHHGFFSASIKLPADYTAGVVVAFYTSNGDVFAKNHDELDFEFLGNKKGEEWRIQTNVYGNGSTSRGREERYLLPFDPTQETHTYSILWTSENIIFYIDETPIREVRRSKGGDYPSKPMSIYATIWDGSTWATDNGKYKINYKYGPFVAEFSNLVLQGCRTDSIEQVPSERQCAEAEDRLKYAKFANMSPEKRQAMLRYRERYITYSHCYDLSRYPNPLPDCELIQSEQRKVYQNALASVRRRRSKRRNRSAYTTATTTSDSKIM